MPQIELVQPCLQVRQQAKPALLMLLEVMTGE